MGKASKFFKSLFAFKSLFKSHKPHHHHHPHFPDTSLTRPRDTPLHHHSSDQPAGADGSTNHAVAVAAATAAFAEAAVAAAQAAAEVVPMTSKTTTGTGADYEWAAVKIQSYFRAYLARKALRALKALVKLQALVRGHILRKQAADDLRRLQALVRAQARARLARIQIADSPHSITKGPPTPEKFEHVVRSRSAKHNQTSMLKNNGLRFHDERHEKILEMDATRTHIRRRNLFQSDHISYSHSQSLTTSRGSTIQPPGLSPSGSCEVNSLTAPFRYSTHDAEEEVSPSVFKDNGSMRASPFTPAKSDSSRSCLSGYSDHPNYMAYTESSRAKARSLSAPRQRPNFELPSATKRYSVYGYGLGGQQRGSNLRDSFVSKAYPGSGRLDRLGMPVGVAGCRESDFSGGYWN